MTLLRRVTQAESLGNGTDTAAAVQPSSSSSISSVHLQTKVENTKKIVGLAYNVAAALAGGVAAAQHLPFAMQRGYAGAPCGAHLLPPYSGGGPRPASYSHIPPPMPHLPQCPSGACAPLPTIPPCRGGPQVSAAPWGHRTPSAPPYCPRWNTPVPRPPPRQPIYCVRSTAVDNLNPALAPKPVSHIHYQPSGRPSQPLHAHRSPTTPTQVYRPPAAPGVRPAAVQRAAHPPRTTMPRLPAVEPSAMPVRQWGPRGAPMPSRESVPPQRSRESSPAVPSPEPQGASAPLKAVAAPEAPPDRGSAATGGVSQSGVISSEDATEVASAPVFTKPEPTTKEAAEGTKNGESPSPPISEEATHPVRSSSAMGKTERGHAQANSAGDAKGAVETTTATKATGKEAPLTTEEPADEKRALDSSTMAAVQAPSGQQGSDKTADATIASKEKPPKAATTRQTSPADLEEPFDDDDDDDTASELTPQYEDEETTTTAAAEESKKAGSTGDNKISDKTSTIDNNDSTDKNNHTSEDAKTTEEPRNSDDNKNSVTVSKTTQRATEQESEATPTPPMKEEAGVSMRERYSSPDPNTTPQSLEAEASANKDMTTETQENLPPVIGETPTRTTALEDSTPSSSSDQLPPTTLAEDGNKESAPAAPTKAEREDEKIPSAVPSSLSPEEEKGVLGHQSTEPAPNDDTSNKSDAPAQTRALEDQEALQAPLSTGVLPPLTESIPTAKGNASLSHQLKSIDPPVEKPEDSASTNDKSSAFSSLLKWPPSWEVLAAAVASIVALAALGYFVTRCCRRCCLGKSSKEDLKKPNKMSTDAHRLDQGGEVGGKWVSRESFERILRDSRMGSQLDFARCVHHQRGCRCAVCECHNDDNNDSYL